MPKSPLPTEASAWGPLRFDVTQGRTAYLSMKVLSQGAVSRAPGASPQGIASAPPLSAGRGSAPTRSLGGLPAFSPLVGAAAPLAGGQATGSVPSADETTEATPLARTSGQPATPPQAGAKTEAPLCKTDRECKSGTICERGECVRLRTRINVLYLFYRSASRRYTSVLGLYHHRWGLDGFRVVAPLYFHFWNRRVETRVIAPLFVSRHNKRTGRKDTVFLNFHHVRSPKGTAFNIWPFLFTSARPHRGVGVTLLPLFHYSRDPKRWSFFSLLPLPFYGSRSETARRFFVLPFTGGRLGKERSFVWAAPLSFYWRRGATKRWLFLPLYYGVTDRKGERNRGALFPFFYHSRHGQTQRRIVSLLFTWSRDRQAGSRTFVWHLPTMVFSRDRDRRLNLVFPLYLGHTNRLRGSALHVVPPFVHYRDRRQTASALLPLFYLFRDKRSGAYSTLLLPLFYRHRDVQGSRLTVLGPWFLEQRGISWKTGLFPLLWAGKGRHRSHAVVFPVFWHLTNKRQGRSFTLVGNVFARRGPESWSFGVLPLAFGGRSPSGHHAVLFPLFWHRVNRTKKSAFTVAGPAFWWRKRDDWGHGVVPLYWFQRSYAAGGHVSSSLFVFPFLFNHNSPGRRLLVTPLFGYSEDRVKRTRTGVALTSFWRSSPTTRSVGVLPFYAYHQDRRRQTTTHYFLPLNVVHRGPQSAATVLFPLLWHFRNPERKAIVVAPLFWHLRQKHGWNLDVLFPVFFKMNKGQRSILSVGPFYQERTPEHVRRVGVFPLLHAGWSRKVAYGHFLPLVFHYRNRVKGTGFTVAGPFYRVLRKGSKHDGVVPLAFWGHHGSKRYAVGLPLVWHFSDTAKASATTFVGPLFWHRRKAVVGGGLAPLLWFQSGPDRKQVTLFPLIHVEKRSQRLRVWTPLFGFGWDRAQGSHHGYVGPVYWDRSRTKSSQVLFPLFWRYASRAAGTATTLLFPLYYAKRTPETQLNVLFPLVWHYRTVTSRTVFVFPLFYDSVAHHEARTTAVVPLFFRRRVHHRNDTMWIFPPSVYVRTRPGKVDVSLFPLFWHHQRPGGKKTTVLFPLYWDFARSKDRRVVVGLPLYYDVKRPNYRATVVFPVFWRFRKGPTERLVILNSYYERNTRDKTWQYMFLPLFDVGRRRPGDIRFSVLGGLVGYERIGRNRRLRLFFIPINLKPTAGAALTPSPPPTRARARALSWDPF